MKRLRVATLARRNQLDKERPKLIFLLRFADSSELVIVDADNLATFDDDIFAVVLPDHLILVVKVVLKFCFEGAVSHGDILGSRWRACNDPLEASALHFAQVKVIYLSD